MLGGGANVGGTWELSQGAHSTTLFSLISLGYTPNLEQFWKDVSCRLILSTAPA